MSKLKNCLFAVAAIFLSLDGSLAIAQSSLGSAGSSSSRSSRSSRSSHSSRSSDSGGSGRSSASRGETTNDRDRSRNSRHSTRENNSRRSSRDSKTGSDAKAKAGDAGNKDTKTVEASKKKESGKSGKSSGGGGRPPVNITFEMQADPETNIMYIESAGSQPSLNISALENKKFITRVSLYNAKSSEFNQFDVSIKYDPQLLQPLGVDDSALSGSLTKPTTIRVDKRRGVLSLSGDFKDTRNDSFMTIAKLQWKALAPAAATPIRLLNTEAHPSGVFNKYGENILHAKSNEVMEVSPETGLLNATVSIEPPNGAIEMAEESSNPFSAVSLATNISMGTAEGGMQIALVPRQPSVSVGEEFLVDIVYRNPKRADLDTVKLEIRFDPRVLQVIDADAGNWITRGINIFDGAYHEQLPFDFHRKNVAFNTTGLIQYEMGFSARTAIPAEGVIATIKFQAEEPAQRTVIAFATKTSDDTAAPASRETTISFLGFNLIGKPGDRAAAIHNAAITVR